ncbi:MAG: hypothetical protein ACKVP7_09625 [Hyphomicrobiaceae bacterium]
MSKEPQRQIAICYLLLKGEHWIPFAPGRRLSAGDRSSPDGPVIMAELIAEVDGGRIVGWSEVGASLQDVGPDGEVAPPDTRLAASIIGALMADGTASLHGAVGINSRIVEAKRAKAEYRLPNHLRASALARAEIQILDKLHGFSAVGVRLIQAPIDETGEP